MCIRDSNVIYSNGPSGTAPTSSATVLPVDTMTVSDIRNAVESGSNPGHNDSVMHKLVNANSKEELDEIIRMSGL